MISISRVLAPLRRSNQFTFCLAAFVSCSVNNLSAQVIDCTGHISGGVVHQVYMNDLILAKSALQNDPDLERFVERLSFNLRTKFQESELAEEDDNSVRLEFSFCSKRRPVEGDFTPRLIEQLDDDNVILEVLGLLDGDVSTDATISRRRATITFILVPVLAENPNLKKAAKHSVQFLESAMQGTLIDRLGEARELQGFVTAGVGIKLLRDDRYDDAYRRLVDAMRHLRNCSKPPKSLIAYVEKKVEQTVGEARNDPSYEGALRDLVDPADVIDEGEPNDEE